MVPSKNPYAFVRCCDALLFVGILGCIILLFHRTIARNGADEQSLPLRTKRSLLGQKHDGAPFSPSTLGPCAINLYGLPRKFKDMVLPGLITNVIAVNAKYQCDYFVHYFDRKEESDYRGADVGRGGSIDPEEVKLLTDEVEHWHTAFASKKDIALRTPTVHFAMDTETSFSKRYKSLLETIYIAKGPTGRPLYLPISEKNPFPNATLANIVKMWHSQETVWNLMEPSTSGKVEEQKHYSRVAMLRSDMVYVTPIDIYQLPDGSMDYRNEYAVIPNFGNFPVNDRMILGPADAVKIWAAGRFSRLAEHVQRVAHFGDGIHPEKYLFHTIFPAIRDAGVTILQGNPDLCFLRVRSDSSVRIGDCGRRCVHDRNQKAIEKILLRRCVLNRSNPDVDYLECKDSVQNQDTPLTFPTKAPTKWESCSWKG